MTDQTFETIPSYVPRGNLVAFCSALTVAAVFVLLSFLIFREGSSADFKSLWLAGEAFANNTPQYIYPTDQKFFTMLPPIEWLDQLKARGYEGEVFPYIYPPIWAWIAGWLSTFCQYDTVISTVALLNPLLLVATVWTARKIAAPKMNAAAYLVIALLVLLFGGSGAIALFQNQPQILVAFLTVLAIERAEHRAPLVAGIALALAASIKLYPAFYIFIWLFGRQFKAASAFFVTGAALASLSIALAGWPLHAEFLRLIRVISDTTLITPITYTAESALAHLFYVNDFTFIHTAQLGDTAVTNKGWLAQESPKALSLCIKMAQAISLLWLASLLARTSEPAQRAAIWPFALILISALGAMAWTYHYIAAVAFVPMLVARLGKISGIALIAVLTLATSPFTRPHLIPAQAALESGDAYIGYLHAISTAAMIGLGVVYDLIRKRRDQTSAA
jgi:hypothetical protein